MDTKKWDFRLEQPVEDNGAWRIAYRLTSGGDAPSQERIAIDERYVSAQTAIDEATRLAQIHVADLNGEAPSFEKPTQAEVPFDKRQRF